MAYLPTNEQTAVLGHDFHRHAVVLSGPGTGKSATLVALVNLSCKVILLRASNFSPLRGPPRPSSQKKFPNIRLLPLSGQAPSTPFPFPSCYKILAPGIFPSRCGSRTNGKITKSYVQR
jgi:hypothetical protein